MVWEVHVAVNSVMPALSTLDKGNCRCILQLRNSSRNILHIYIFESSFISKSTEAHEYAKMRTPKIPSGHMDTHNPMAVGMAPACQCFQSALCLRRGFCLHRVSIGKSGCIRILRCMGSVRMLLVCELQNAFVDWNVSYFFVKSVRHPPHTSPHPFTCLTCHSGVVQGVGLCCHHP